MVGPVEDVEGRHGATEEAVNPKLLPYTPTNHAHGTKKMGNVLQHCNGGSEFV